MNQGGTEVNHKIKSVGEQALNIVELIITHTPGSQIIKYENQDITK